MRFTNLAERLELPVFQWGALVHSGWRAVIAGDLVRAEQLADDTWGYGVTHGRPEADIIRFSQRSAIRWLQGRLGDEVEPLGTLAEDLVSVPALRASYSLAVLHSGRADEAHERLLDCRRRSSGDVGPRAARGTDGAANGITGVLGADPGEPLGPIGVVRDLTLFVAAGAATRVETVAPMPGSPTIRAWLGEPTGGVSAYGAVAAIAATRAGSGPADPGAPRFRVRCLA